MLRWMRSPLSSRSSRQGRRPRARQCAQRWQHRSIMASSAPSPSTRTATIPRLPASRSTRVTRTGNGHIRPTSTHEATRVGYFDMPDIHRIGVISDTHLPQVATRIPDAALQHFADVKLIIHAGDLSTLAAINQLSAYASVEAVQGNVETQEVILPPDDGYHLEPGNLSAALSYQGAAPGVCLASGSARPGGSLCGLLPDGVELPAGRSARLRRQSRQKPVRQRVL